MRRVFPGLVSIVLLLTAAARGAVSLGIDELEKSHFAILQGKRVGLVTNPSGRRFARAAPPSTCFTRRPMHRASRW